VKTGKTKLKTKKFFLQKKIYKKPQLQIKKIRVSTKPYFKNKQENLNPYLI